MLLKDHYTNDHNGFTTAPTFETFQFDLCKNLLKDYPKNAFKSDFCSHQVHDIACLSAVSEPFLFSEDFLLQRTEVYMRSPPWCNFTAAQVEKNEWAPQWWKTKHVFIQNSQKRRLWMCFLTFDLHFYYAAWPDLQSSLSPAHETHKMQRGHITLTKREKYAPFCCSRNLPTITKQFIKFRIAELPRTLIFTRKK